MKKKLSLLMVALVAIAAFAGLRRAAEQVVTYALAEGDTFTSGQTVDVKNGEEVVATITYGFSGGADFNAAAAEATLAEKGFAAFTAGNGVNGTENSGTCYIITPKYAGSIEVAVVLNNSKPFFITEDGTALEGYNGIKVEAKYYGTYSFQVKANSVYKVYCTGSKLGFYGFKYTYEVEEQGGGGTSAIEPATDPIVLDFTSQSNWNIPTSGTNKDVAEFTDGKTTIKLSATTNYKLNDGYLILGKKDSYLELPAFAFDVEKIEVVGTSGASEAVKQNIYVGEDAVSTETTGAKNVTNVYTIAEASQAAGNIYKLVVTSAHNTQISKITVYPKTAVKAPTFTPGEGEFIDAPSVELSCETEDASIYYTTDGTKPTSESTLYTGAINITETTTIKAFAVKDNIPSSASSATYTIVTPLTVAQVIEKVGEDGSGKGNCYVQGIVSKVESYDETNKSITYWISEDGTTEGQQFEAYNGKGLNGADFTSIDDVKVGAKVVIYGYAKKYTPKDGDPIYEFDSNNKLVKYVPYFSVSIAEGIENGTIQVDKSKAAEGEEVTITATPAEGYELESISVTCKTIDETVIVTDGKFTMPADGVTVNATFVKAPVDVVVAAADITDGDITAAIAAKAAGAPVKKLTVTLTENGVYTVSAPIEASASIAINGAAGATIDASGNAGDFITLQGSTVFAKKSDDTDSDHYLIAAVSVSDVKISGLKGALITDAQKTLLETLTISNAVVEMPAAGKNVINFNGKGYVGKVVVKNSTIWANGMNTGFFAQYGSRPKNVNGDWLQEFDVQNSTIVNIANGKNICDLKQNGTAQNVYTLKNNIFVDCGKSAQVVVGFNKGQTSATPVWAVDGNIFNFGGVDTSAAEVEKAGKAGEEDIVKNSIAGVVTFTDAAAGDFNGKITLPIGAVVPEGKVGDPRWTVAYKETGAVLWSSEEPATIVWDQANIAVAAEKFANAKVGDVMHVLLQDVPTAAANPWDAQVALRALNWKDLEAKVSVAGTAGESPVAAKAVADFVLTGDILTIAKEQGVQINGVGCKTAQITLEYADEVAGSDASIWFGSSTKNNVSIDINHFANSNLFNGIKVGDKIRVTVKKTDAEKDNWVGLNYQNASWVWSEFAEGSFATTTTETSDGAIVDFEVLTAEAIEILNNRDNVYVIINNPKQTVTQVELIVAPVDIEISPAEGDIYAALKAETDKVVKVGAITINLAADGAYTVSAPIVAPASLFINGNGATITAAATLITTPTGDLTDWMDGNLIVKDATIDLGANAFYVSAGKNYLYNDFKIENCVVKSSASIVFDFRKGGVAKTFSIDKSTVYSPTATNNSIYSSQSAQKGIEAPGVTVQTFAITNSTMYNYAVGKNFFTHRQSNQTWLAYTITNSIFLNVGKSGQVVKGINQGQSGKNPTWNIDGNVFNFDGKDTSADESTGDDEEPVKNSIAGVVTFTDAAAGDFNGSLVLAPGTETPATMPGDPRWTVTAAAGYAVKVENCEGMTITPEVAYAAEGTKVYATYTVAEGYQLDKPEFVDDNGDAIPFAEGQVGLEKVGDVEKMFIIMPATNVTIKAKASKIYQITLDLSQENGSATCLSVNSEDPSTFFKKEGKEIYLAITPASNYEAEISVMAGETAVEVVAEAGTTKDGQAYTHKFIMPASDVTITVTFKSTVGINSITADKMKNATIYNMKGQRVDKAQKGLYIVNGKKVVLK